MTLHKQQFESMKIPEKLEAMKEAWIKQMPLENINAPSENDYQRLIKVLLYLEAHFKFIDEELYPSHIWQESINHFNNIITYGQQYKSSPNEGYLQHANNEADALLKIFHLHNKIATPEIVEAITKSVVKFTETVSEQLKELAGKRVELEKQVTELTQKLTGLDAKSVTTDQTIQNQIQRLEVIISEHQKQFSSAQEQRVKDFSTEQGEQKKSFTKTMETFKTIFTKRVEDEKEIFDKNTQQYKNDSDKLYAEMQETQRKTEKIYGIVGKDSIVGSHKVYADNAKRFAHFLFWLSIFIMVVVSITVIYPLLSIMFSEGKTFKELDWLLLACRIPIASILFLPAFYLANEAKKQREKENRYRELEIKMATIAPYFNEIGNQTQMELPEKEKMKIELAQKLLSPIEEKEDKHVVIPPDVLELIKTIVNLKNK